LAFQTVMTSARPGAAHETTISAQAAARGKQMNFM
jgi:hypothetical protein